ncbi:MAG TPA: FAD/NAD(P)-binding oxidoreductase [Clostridiales bacterium]|nr:FAD/NAD(P)-binding oxidoreductase [Clostridiales bacterium]
MKDVIIIGGGVVGCSVARELSRFDADILLLERGNDVSVGTSKANSGIVHGGYDAKPGTLKAKFNVAGNAMFDALARELDFPFKRNGSMVLCFDKADIGKLLELKEQGVKNGVQGLYVLEGYEAVKAMEPYVSENVVAALVVSNGGIVSPYEMTIAYAENAATNGVEFRFGSEVTAIDRNDGGLQVTCADGFTAQAKYVVNAAGVYADVINNMISPDKMHITARKGDYELLDKTCGYMASHTLFQMPTKMGKGVLVTPTCHGNILVGPTATDVTDKDDVATTPEELASAFDRALLTMPSLNRRNIITQFSGLRAHLDTDDFVIGESAAVKGLYNVAGIESPGLSSAPAIAVHVAEEIAKKLSLGKNANFVAERKGIPHFATLSDEERQKLVAENPLYGRIVCRCETVTEGEIVEAIRRKPGAVDMDGVKRRTRQGMGRCQAGFCTPRVMEILSRELGVPMTEVTKRGGNSQFVIGRTK